jgi:LysR family transcriptional activator of nhaA
VIADRLSRQYTVQAVGRIEAVTEQLYAITTERRLLHPAIFAVVQATQREFFGKTGPSQNRSPGWIAHDRFAGRWS